MRIIFNEMKKIFSFKMVFLLIIISLIMFKLFIKFDFKYFPNGRPERDNYKISVQMLKDYGTSMDENEFLHFKELYNKQLEEASEYLKTIPEFVKAGITTYDDFMEISMQNNELSKIHNSIIFKEQVDMFWELQVRKSMISTYERKDMSTELKSSFLNKNLAARLTEIVKSESINSVLPYFIFENYKRLSSNLAILIMVSIIFMISPIFIKDNTNKLNYLQYSSKAGRKLFGKKIIAALLSALVIITIHVVWFFILYSGNDVEMFFYTNINSTFNSYKFWYDVTFIQYIILTVMLIYILGLTLTLIVALVSSTAPNYITIIGVQIPITFTLFTLTSSLLINIIGGIKFPRYLQPLGYLILISVSIILITIRRRKERVVDVVN